MALVPQPQPSGSISLTATPLTPGIGALVEGVDLASLSDETTVEQLYDLLLRHLVIVFPGQRLTPAAQLAFAQRFGELDAPHHVYPHVPGHERVVLLENDGTRAPNTDVWHSDLTFKDNPPFASVLCAKVVPETGGDTLWASMYAAYDALPDGMKSDIATLSAVHAMGSYWNEYHAAGGIDAIKEAMRRLGAAVHPIVGTHPVTGRAFLYVNRHFTTHVLGMTSAESQRLLAYLFDHIEQPDFQVRLRWRPGTLAMWDNRVTQHYAVPDYETRRVMHRVTLDGDRPY